MSWYRPQTLEDLLCLKSKYPDARVAVGNTEVGVEVKFKNCFYEVVIQPSQVSFKIEFKKFIFIVY
jgi:xanthine dehydrogenase/oxidase